MYIYSLQMLCSTFNILSVRFDLDTAKVISSVKTIVLDFETRLLHYSKAILCPAPGTINPAPSFSPRCVSAPTGQEMRDVRDGRGSNGYLFLLVRWSLSELIFSDQKHGRSPTPSSFISNPCRKDRGLLTPFMNIHLFFL